MHQGPRLRPAVLAARETLELGRAKLRKLHDEGSPAVQVCACLTDLLDGVVLDLYHAALAETGDAALESELALVPIAGYARRDTAPFSDVDLMLLYSPASRERVTPVAKLLTQQLCDAGLAVGHSFRTPNEACRLALQDATVFTSLAEARYLGGSVRLYGRFARKLQRDTRRNCRRLITAVERERAAERHRFGETIYLLKPNIKQSPGGLRDLQLVRWIGFARYGESETEILRRMDVLSSDDLQKLRKSHAFLLRLRNEMHFEAGKPQDVLGRSEQLRMAELFNYAGSEGVLPVEAFMRDYFEHTGEGQHAVDHFLASVRWGQDPRRPFRRLFSYRMEGDFRVGPIHIGVVQKSRDKVCGDLAQVLRLMDLANQTNTRIEHETWEAIRDSMTSHADLQLTEDAARRFLALMSSPPRLANLLRRLHELRVLEKIIPAMAHARCLLQFNEYHKYTVDEHCLRAVQCATEFQRHTGPLGKAYRGIRHKRTLHLALLLHDLGKGFADDHSEVGLRLTAETAVHLRLPAEETETLKFLVHQHLKMAHMAFRQDLNDDNVILNLAMEVGSLDVLQMFYVLTCADLAAVGPDVLNNWKLDLLTQLYERTREQLAGDEISVDTGDWMTRHREAVLAAVSSDLPWWSRQIESLPNGYVRGHSVKEIREDLSRLHDLPADRAVAWGRYQETSQVIEYTVVAHEDITPGIFHRLTGVLTRMSNKILKAEIHTLADNRVLDRFSVEDKHFSGAPSAMRLDEVSRALEKSLMEPTSEPPKFPQLWQDKTNAAETQPTQLPPRVRVDNESSDRFTIVTVFAHDRLGLLYAITKSLFDNGASVHEAKISTQVDQIVDVFFVTSADGQKIANPVTLDAIKQGLLAEIERIERVAQP